MNSLDTTEKRYFDIPRRVISHMTAESWMTVPHVAFDYEPDVTNFLAVLRGQCYGEGAKGVTQKRLTINTAMLKVIACGLEKAPSLNTHVAYSHAKGEGSLSLKRAINIAVPWLLPDGHIITPTVRDCGVKSLPEIDAEVTTIARKIANTDVNELLYSAIVNDTVQEARRLNLGVLRRIIASKLTRRPVRGLKGRDREDYYGIGKEDRLTKEDLLDATVSVSNIGSLYKGLRGGFAMLQIIPPQIFAIGISAVQERVGVYQDAEGRKATGIRSYLPMALVFDHRAVDFGDLLPFIKECDAIFEEPARLFG